MRLRANQRRDGFTILELAVALALITLVASVAIGAWFGRSDVTLVKAAELLAHDVRMAQARASLRSSPHEVVFHDDGGGYRVHDVRDGASSQFDDTRRWDFDAVFEGVRLMHVVSKTPGRVVFDARGGVSGDASITLSFAGHARTIVVDGRSHEIVIADASR